MLTTDLELLSIVTLELARCCKRCFLNRVNIVSEYDREIRSPSFSMKLPSVISLKQFVKPSEFPNFTDLMFFKR